MSQTLDQIFIANPSTTVLSTDLFYLVHSPYAPGDDSAITGANLKLSFGSVNSITGDSGTITGSALSIFAGNSSRNAGSTVKFTNSGTVSTLDVSDGASNTFVGNEAGNLVGFSGTNNSGFGVEVLTFLTSGASNTAMGVGSMLNSTTASFNAAYGQSTLVSLTIGDSNTSLGCFSGNQIISGNYNTYLGFQAGTVNAGAESSNIYINNIGVLGESNTLRIGAATGIGNQELSAVYVCGINGITTGNPVFVTVDTATNRLGVSAAGVINIIDGDSGSITGSTVTIRANTAALTCGSSVSFTNSGTTSTLNVSDSQSNTIIGSFAGNASPDSQFNTGLGSNALTALTTGFGNCGLGLSILSGVTSGSRNCALGFSAGYRLTTGNFNIYIGDSAGSTHTGAESSNIYLSTNGTVGESNVLRIGTATGTGDKNLSTAFVSGINGNTLSGTPLVVTIDPTTDQLGVAAFPSGGSVSIDGDTGTISGSSLTIFANNTANNCGSSILFTNTGTVSTLNVSDANSNTFLGKLSGNLTLTGSNNAAFGQGTMAALSSGIQSCAFGFDALQRSTTGAGNVAVGYGSLGSSVADSQNVGVGSQTFLTLNGGFRNTGLGTFAGINVATGTYNLYLGYSAGINNSGAESSNIYLNTVAVISESNCLRIGSATGTSDQQLSTAFISGINGNTLGGTPLVVTIDPSTDQLGTAAFPSGGSVTITGDTGSISGSALTIFANNAGINCGSSVSFTNSGTTSTFNVTDGGNNTIIGKNAGNATLTGTVNVGYGLNSVNSLTSGTFNCGIGPGALQLCTSGSSNAALGQSCLLSVSTGNFNCGLGNGAGLSVTSGNYGIFIGNLCGSANTSSESSNIYFNSPGSSGESNALRIGAGTGSSDQQLSTAFISGINGNTLGGTPLMVTIDSSTDQLGVQAIPSGGSVSITGDSGSISGSSLTIYSNTAAQNCGSSVSFVNSGTTSTLNVTDASNNTIIGLGAGNASVAGTGHVGLGQGVFASLTGGSDNVAIGRTALAATSSDSALVAIGAGALAVCNGAAHLVSVGNFCLGNLVTGDDNVGMGWITLITLNGGSHNTAIGSQSAYQLATGNYNLTLGFNAGGGLTSSESNNILLSSPGVAGDSNTLRIGSATGTGTQQLSKSFISGINGNTLSGTPLMVTIDSSTDQLGVQAIPTSGSIPWTDKAVSFGAAVNNAYVCTSPILATLPASPSQGDTVFIYVNTAGTVVVLANTGQTIVLGANTSTSGGTATNNAKGDSLQLIYNSASVAWLCVASVGSWTLA